MSKDEAAVALGKKRWKGIPKDERKTHASSAATERWANATEADRAEVGKKLAAARAAKKAAAKKVQAKKVGKK
jgi:hypothetical protein